MYFLYAIFAFKTPSSSIVGFKDSLKSSLPKTASHTPTFNFVPAFIPVVFA
ncbi:hypothetical protein [uncultured Flavobacterium sp.]|uniref:hypothetical protein n=1 Tax=uncultured Flavobacterium sp. TaxID=165435 RepID=UPI0030EBC52D|tara:strand:- start:8317 stop:8469 length:153 start_codon:yes stop_codon:yes gene_type:complete